MVSVIYRSPSQTNDELEAFLSNFQMLLNDKNNRKPSLSVINGDVNSRCSSQWYDVNTKEGSKLFSLTSSNGFSQLINGPTHIQANTVQANLSVNSGDHAFIHPNCHHQIAHSSFNPNIYYPPLYQDDTKTIRKALDSVNWESLFDSKNISAQVIALNRSILNVFRNYVPNKYKTIDDKGPVWINQIIKSKIKTKNLLFKPYIQNGRFETDFVFLETLITEINELIFSARNLYYENLAKQLNNPLLQAKTYWSILKTFYNEKNSQ